MIADLQTSQTVVDSEGNRRPSAALLELARMYLNIVDNGIEQEQGEIRTRAHDALMAQMRAEKIPFSHRAEAREIARWLVRGEHLAAGTNTRLMWARCWDRANGGKANPHTEGAVALYFSAEAAEKMGLSKEDAQALVPVMVTIEPFPIHDLSDK